MSRKFFNSFVVENVHVPRYHDPHMKVIAISGLARAGKDTLADALKEQILSFRPNVTVEKMSFAQTLREDLFSFVQEKFGEDVFNLSPEKKEIFRPLMVGYGFAKRAVTNGRYFVESLDKRMQGMDLDFCLISDLRFASTANDELSWLQKEKKGKLIHVRRYDIDPTNGRKHFQKAPNFEEKANDPLLRKAADINIEWQTLGDENLLRKEAKVQATAICDQLLPFFF